MSNTGERTSKNTAQRESWMLDAPENLFDGKKKRVYGPDRSEASRVCPDTGLKISEKELNPYVKTHGSLQPKDSVESSLSDKSDKQRKRSSGGSKWRAMKIKRILEQAEREKKPIEEVALLRYNSLEDFYDDLKEKEELEISGSLGSVSSRSNRNSHVSSERYNSRKDRERKAQRIEEARRNSDFEKKRESLVFSASPSLGSQESSLSSESEQVKVSDADSTLSRPAMPEQASLNKLKAQELRDQLFGSVDSDRIETLANSVKNPNSTSSANSQETLPNFDIRGNYVDVGRKGKRKASSSSNADAGEKNESSVKELLRMEKSNEYDMNTDFARMIKKNPIQDDARSDYLEANSSNYAKVKYADESKKRRKAIQNYSKTQSILEKCWYCLNEQKMPDTPTISIGLRVYLTLPMQQPLVRGHCYIIPMEHHLTSLECDDDEWDEIENFMKCLIRAFHARGKGVVFFESSMYFRKQRHAFIEAVPVPYDKYDQCPGYFKQALLSADEEWSQHKKIIDTRKHGFRKSLVQNLPYFHVWFGMEPTYGHVIEDEDSWSPYFAKEILGNILDCTHDRWRRPKMMDYNEREKQKQKFLNAYAAYDWTDMITASKN